MNRKDFLKLSGLAGAASLFPLSLLKADEPEPHKTSACVLTPTETEGPFPLDLTASNTYFRQDVRETKTGVRLNLKMKIIGQGNCQPMPNVRVNIWSCDKDGLYSGYSQTNNPGQAGLTYLRGWQMTNANGEAEFITIFPGWYTGRICHIHFQVYLSSVYKAVSQLTFPIATKNAIYATNASLYPKGADPMTLASDNIFSDGYTYQMATLTPNTTTGGYDAYLEVTVNGSGPTGLLHYEGETGGQFKMGQNFPNPYQSETTVPFTLTNPADVKIELYDLNGRKVAEVKRPGLQAGTQQIALNLENLRLAQGSYIYQLETTNKNGTFRQCKMMTAAR